MSSQQVWQALLEAVSHLPSLFRPGQLAFLTATSKVEHPVRDALATYLHEQFGPELTVGREVGRGDLSVQHHSSFLLRGEHKALYAFDAADPSKRALFQRKIEHDRHKLLRARQPAEIQYVLTTMTLLGPHTPLELENTVVKYARDQRRTLERINLPHHELRPAAAQSWTDVMTQVCAAPVSGVQYDLGEFAGIPIGLDVHLGQVQPDH